jgi:hypothetical protein
MLPPLQRLPLAVCAPAGAEPTSAGEFGMAELRESLPRPYQGFEPPHPLTRYLVAETRTLVPFSVAFHPPPPPPAEQRWIAKEAVDGTALSAVLAVRRWVKIGGKNGMDPVDVNLMLNGGPRETINEVLEPFRSDKTVGYVFDGDNYEPDKAPFSVIIGELIAGGHTVVAVKTAEPRMVNGAMTKASVSRGFYEGWEGLAREHPETFVMAVMPETIQKEDVTRKADAFVFWGSTFVAEEGTGRNYRFRPDHSPTQGWTEIQEFKQDEHMVCRELGEGENTFLAVKKDF